MYIVVVIAGAIFMMNGAIDPSQLVAYLLYITTLINSIHRIVQFTEQFQSGMSGVERFFQVMDAPIEISDAPDAKDIGIVKGDVTFDHVSFKYNDDGTEVLSDIDLDVKAGENIALVALRAAVKRRCATSFRVFTIRLPAPSASTARISVR